MPENSISQIQAKFVTKNERYSIPDTPYSIPVTLDADSLSELVNGLLINNGTNANSTVLFDFLITGAILSNDLEKHIDVYSISTEEVIEIEYFERLPSPEPQDSLIHDDWVSAIHSFNKFILTGCYDNTLKLWRTNGENLLTLTGHTNAVKSVKWITKDADAKRLCFVSTSHDETALIWEWNTEASHVNSIGAGGDENSTDTADISNVGRPGDGVVTCKQMCKGHAASVDCVAVNKSSTRFATGSYDNMLKIWNAESEGDSGDTGETPAKKSKRKTSKVPTRVPMMTLSGHKEGVTGVQWLEDNCLCSTSLDHTIRLWDVQRGEETSKINGVKVFLDSSYSQNNRTLITGSSDRHIRLYDPRVNDGAVVKTTFSSHNGWVSGVCWSPHNEDQFISGSYDHLVKLWDRRSPSLPLYDLKGHEDRVMAVDWSLPSLMLSGGADNHLKLFSQTQK